MENGELTPSYPGLPLVEYSQDLSTSHLIPLFLLPINLFRIPGPALQRSDSQEFLTSIIRKTFSKSFAYFSFFTNVLPTKNYKSKIKTKGRERNEVIDSNVKH